MKRKEIIFFLFIIVIFVINTEELFSVEKRNETYLQVFYWEMNKDKYATKYPEEANLWQLLSNRSLELQELGITGVLLPPASKADEPSDEGYAVYDLWDLGEFDQKGSIRTRYGSKKDLQRVIDELHDKGIKVFFDAVLNHRMGGDELEEVPLASGAVMKINSIFKLQGRKKYYSEADNWLWNWKAFDGIDLSGPILFSGKSWDNSVDRDCLMGFDLDYQNRLVVEEMKEWGHWIINEIGFDGFRVDSIKHIDSSFITEWIDYVDENTEKDIVFIGEAWYETPMGLILYLKNIKNEKLCLFDFSLRKQFSLLRDGLLNMAGLDSAGLINNPVYGDRMVSFIDNHDTGRDFVEYTSPIFARKYQAYTYIMTREKSIPVLFWKDFYNSGMRDDLEKILQARKYYAYGSGYEVENNDSDVYSYVRAGLKEILNSGLVMMISGGDNGVIITKEINSRQPERKFFDLTGNISGIVETDSSGIGRFKVINSIEKGWSIWVPCYLIQNY